jgi:hypothetical protein
MRDRAGGTQFAGPVAQPERVVSAGAAKGGCEAACAAAAFRAWAVARRGTVRPGRSGRHAAVGHTS